MSVAEVQTLFQCLVNCTSGSVPPTPPAEVDADAQYCSTPGCIESANNFLQSIDFNVDPCDDFYAHACGKWVRETRLPDDKSSLSRFTLVYEVMEKRLEALLSTPSKSGSIGIREAKDLYASCVDLDSRESDGLKQLQATLEEFGGLPILGNNNAEHSHVDVSKLLATMARDYGTLILVDGGVSMDLFHPKNNILQVWEGGLGIPARDYYVVEDSFIEKIRNGYLAFMIKVGTLLLKDLGKPVDEAKLKGEFEKVLAFERQIAKAHRTPVEKRDLWSQMNYYSLKNSSNSFSWLNWGEYLRILMPEKTQKLLTDDFTFIIAAPKYFSDMNTIMQSTDKETVINYIYWRFVQSWSYSYTADLRNLVDEFNQLLTGQIAPTPNWKHCVKIVHASPLAEAVGALYARKYLQGTLKEKSKNLVLNSLHTFSEKILKGAPFMDAATMKIALEKSAAIDIMVTYPEYVMNDKALDKNFEGLSSSSNLPYFIKRSHLNKWKISYNLLKLLRPYERKFPISAAIINAYFDLSANSIIIPGGILAAPFYSVDNINAVNYGGIAAVIGHELSHGFDDQGRQFDINGKLSRWWTQESEEKFNKLKSCFVDQYSAHFVDQAGMKVNGKLTLGENIADNGGVRTAYLAYKNIPQKVNGNMLPGIKNYTSDQLFFLSYANVWCQKQTKESAVQSLRTDTHSPSEARVNIPLTNFEAFAKSFKCPVGSNMNPGPEYRRCRLW